MGNDDFQWADLLQAYGQLWFKTGADSGLELTFGKFLELAGSESAEATNNLLYSHSDIYTFLEPTTHTGGMAKYIFNSQFFAYFGVVEGWDVVEDNNTAETYIAGGGWSSKAQVAGHAQTQALLNIITGPERTDDDSDYRTLTDVVINQSWTEKLTESLNFDWLAEENVPGIAHKRADALRRGALPDVRLQRLRQRHVAAGGDARRRRLADGGERRPLREHDRREPDAGAEPCATEEPGAAAGVPVRLVGQPERLRPRPREPAHARRGPHLQVLIFGKGVFGG